MSNKLIIIFSLLILSCKTNLSNTSFIVKEDYKYWEDLSNAEKNKILNSKDIIEKAIAYYNGKFVLTYDQITINFLDTLTHLSNNKEEVIFYFYIFNQICSKADGALSEGLGKYCQKMLLNYPNYVINYFKRNHSTQKLYSEFIGYELYFKEKGKSTMEYNYTDFKKILNDSIGSIEQLKGVLKLFYSDIEISMKNTE